MSRQKCVILSRINSEFRYFVKTLQALQFCSFLLSLVRLSTVTSKTFTEHGHSVTLSDREIRAEAGLCVVIPCYLIATRSFMPQSVAWSKCQRSKSRCQDSDVIFNSADHSLYAGFRGRLSLLDKFPNNCSIIINDLTESDSGSYQLSVDTYDYNMRKPYRYTFCTRANVTVRGTNSLCMSHYVAVFICVKIKTAIIVMNYY